MRIKLIYPPVFDHLCQPTPPESLSILTAVLKQEGFYVEQEDLLIKVRRFNKYWKRINLNIFKNKKEVIDFLLYNKKFKKFDDTLKKILNLTDYKNFDLIGFGAHSLHQFLFALLLSKKIKEETDLPIVIGGYHLTAVPLEIYQKFAFVDYMVKGGGELALLKLISYLEGKGKIEHVPGLMYLKDGKAYQNKPKNLPIEKLPLPDLEGIPLNAYTSRKYHRDLVLTYQMARGCPHKCDFCGIFYQKYESKSVNKAVKELEILSKKYMIKHFIIVDHTINADYNRLNSLCDKLIAKRLDITWGAYARADNFDKSLLSKMKKAGCVKLRFGIESGSARLLKFMHKGINLKKARKILKISHNAGIKNVVFFVAGLPSETKKDLESTVKFIKENAAYIYRISISPFRINYMGSKITKKPIDYGIENLEQDVSVFLFSDTFKQHYDIQRTIPLRLSHDIIYLAYWKYLIRKKFGEKYSYPFRFVPLFLVKTFLKIKKDSNINENPILKNI